MLVRANEENTLVGFFNSSISWTRFHHTFLRCMSSKTLPLLGMSLGWGTRLWDLKAEDPTTEAGLKNSEKKLMYSSSSDSAVVRRSATLARCLCRIMRRFRLYLRDHYCGRSHFGSNGFFHHMDGGRPFDYNHCHSSDYQRNSSGFLDRNILEGWRSQANITKGKTRQIVESKR